MAIPKIRAGNDITHSWAITRNGAPEDLTAIEAGATLTRSNFNTSENIAFEIVDTNKIKSQHLLEQTGVYNLKFQYNLADITLPDRERKCTIDVDAFQIVSKSALADDASEFAVTSDMAIGFKGGSAYQVWLDAGNVGTEADYFTYLQQPAANMIASLNETNEAALTAEVLRTGAESIRLQNEQWRVTAESLRATAEQTRQTNTETAIQNAANATALAVKVAEHPDTIINDYWWKWNTTTNAYENTNIMAKGGVYYPVFRLNPETGILSITADSDFTNTRFEIDKTRGTLLLKINQ